MKEVTKSIWFLIWGFLNYTFFLVKSIIEFIHKEFVLAIIRICVCLFLIFVLYKIIENLCSLSWEEGFSKGRNIKNDNSRTNIR